MAVTVLIVDDSAGVRDTFRALLKLEGFEAATAEDGASGIAEALARRYDVVLVDLHLPDMSGIKVVGELKRLGVRAPMVVFTAFPDLDSPAAAARAAGAVGYVEGPLFGDEVSAVVRGALTSSVPRETASTLPLTPYAPLAVGAPANGGLSQDVRLRHVVQMIQAEPRLSAEDLARRVGLSESRLRHMFAQELGVSLVRFIRFVRVHEAARLLRKGYDGISQIAQQLDLPNLRRVFLARFGMPPREYRARYRDPDREEP